MVVLLRGIARAGVAGTLCVLMAGQPLLGMSASTKTANATGGELQGQARVLHALNRLTFGPRPGDVAAVQAMGLDRWFELQLNPGKIDDSALEARLAEYPAMRMSIAELTARYPGAQTLRAIENGRMELPSDPAERAVAVDELAFYKMQKAKKEKDDAAQKGATGNAAVSGDAGSMVAAGGVGQPGQDALGMGKPKRKQVQAGLAALDEAGAGMQTEKPLSAGEIAADPVMEGTGLGVGYSHETAMAILNLPPDRRYKAVLAMPAQDVVRFRQSLKPREVAMLVEGLTPVEKETLVALPGALRMVAAETMETRVLRDVYSERQLEAVMTDFWLNHFNVYVRKNQFEPYLIPTYERETIRPLALGRFEDLLVATAKSPAMLVYLDNFRSIGPDSAAALRVERAKQLRPNGPLAKAASAGLNENYGRELMELHTLGVNGGYTQADVTQVAKVFTGWTVDKPYQGGGSFQFDERRHEPGAKVVLGKTIHEDGEKEGLEVLHMLGTSPATAHFICQKLAVRFVSDTPPPALVDRMAQSFLSSGGDIKTVLRTMWKSPEFWSTSVERAKVKTPEEFVISAVRASGVEVTNPLAVVMAIDKLGMPLYGMQTPNGYSWMKDGWVSTGALVSRMNFALVLTGDRLPGTRTDWTGLLGSGGLKKDAGYDAFGGSSEAVVKEKRLEAMLLGYPVSERTRATVLGQAGDANVAEQAAGEFDLRGGGGKQAVRYGRGMQATGDGGVADDGQAAVMAGLLLGSPEFQRR
jgi:uncharacterized protein (DUF1800 family)